MIEWREDGLLLAVRPHGEANAILEVLTRGHGRHAGVVRGGQSRKRAPVLQPGAQLDLTWKARLDDHIGAFTVEPVRSRAAQVLGDRAALATLGSVCALLTAALPEREAVAALYDQTVELADALGTEPDWAERYAAWELSLLTELGFGLDLTSCAATGATDDLCFVSPRTGRAVSRAGAGEWADRLLPLPAFLTGGSGGTVDDALRLTGHFLHQWLGPELSRPQALEARDRAARAIRGRAGTP